jgi:hypothetical protein
MQRNGTGELVYSPSLILIKSLMVDPFHMTSIKYKLSQPLRKGI